MIFPKKVSVEIAEERGTAATKLLLFCLSKGGNEDIFNVLWNSVACPDAEHCEIGQKMSGGKLVPRNVCPSAFFVVLFLLLAISFSSGHSFIFSPNT